MNNIVHIVLAFTCSRVLAKAARRLCACECTCSPLCVALLMVVCCRWDRVDWLAMLPASEFRRCGVQWSSIGFQGKDPATDVRAGGLLSVMCLEVRTWSMALLTSWPACALFCRFIASTSQSSLLTRIALLLFGCCFPLFYFQHFATVYTFGARQMLIDLRRTERESGDTERKYGALMPSAFPCSLVYDFNKG